jgi:hypothetical protein
MTKSHDGFGREIAAWRRLRRKINDDRNIGPRTRLSSSRIDIEARNAVGLTSPPFPIKNRHF